MFEPALQARRAALAASEARCRALAEQPGDVVLRVRSDRRRIGVSPAIEAVLGYSVAQARTLSLRAVIHPDDLLRVTAVYDGAVGQHRPRAVRDLPRPAQGRVVHLDGSFFAAASHRWRRAASMEIALSVMQNVTERQQEAEALRLATEAARKPRRPAPTKPTRRRRSSWRG